MRAGLVVYCCLTILFGPDARAETITDSPLPRSTAGNGVRPRIMSEAFSPIISVGAWVLPDGTVGMIDASATRTFSSPCTRNRASTTALGSLVGPMRQEPTG